MCGKHFSVLMFFGEFCEGTQSSAFECYFSNNNLSKDLVTSNYTSYLVPRFSLLENPGNEVVIH